MEEVVCYGGSVRLWSVGQYSNRGGYVGYIFKQRSRRRRNGPHLAIPPVDAAQQAHRFEPSSFKVLDPTNSKGIGEPVRYGDELTLQDDQGLVWNNSQGPISYIGPKPRGYNGQMNVKFAREQHAFCEPLCENDSPAVGTEENIVRYGETDVKLDVVNVNRKLLRRKYSNYITNFKKDASKMVGGYLVCDGRGYPVTFTVHHPPPVVQSVTFFRPIVEIPGHYHQEVRWSLFTPPLPTHPPSHPPSLPPSLPLSYPSPSSVRLPGPA